MSTSPINRSEKKIKHNNSENFVPDKNKWKEHYYELKKYSFVFDLST